MTRNDPLTPGESTPIAVPRSLPRGLHALDGDVVLISQRERLIEACALVVAEKGYVATRVQDITRRARVSRTTFYEQFSDKENCFLAAYEAGTRAHLAHVETEMRRADDWMGQVRNATRAYAEELAGKPAYARAFLVEVHAAGARALALRAAAHRRFADLHEAWYDSARDDFGGAPKLPREVFVGAVGAVDEIAAGKISEGRADELLELVPVLLYVELALFGMGDRARQVLDEPLR